MKRFLRFIICTSIIGCDQSADNSQSYQNYLKTQPAISGTSEFLGTPYVTAGNRLYAVGNQDGSFPDLGWHVTGEMGGIWDHPIKLLDGFTMEVLVDNETLCLNNASQFINYPMANQHIFDLPNGIKVIRTQFVPDDEEGMIISFEFSNNNQSVQSLDLTFTGMIDLRPVWLAERLSIEDGQDTAIFDDSNNIWIAKDQKNPWFVTLSTDQEISSWRIGETTCSYPRKALDPLDISIQSNIKLEPNEKNTVQYFIAGSYQSQRLAIETNNRIKANALQLMQEKIDRYGQIKSLADLSIPDGKIQEMYTWTKYTSDWLIREVPEIGKGLSAGIPDYPWWFGTDNTYALQGLLCIGQHEVVKSTLELLLKLSKQNDNGQIVHEASTNGVVYNPGNLNTAAYFIPLLWKYFLWTGDEEFLERMYLEVHKSISWLESQDKDGNGFPDGAGMMEIHGLHSEMIDVVSYQWAAYSAAAKMAEYFHDHGKQTIYQDKADWLKIQINSTWWVSGANSFADFRANQNETIELIDAAIIRADTINKPWAVEELQSMKKQLIGRNGKDIQSQVVHHNWVVNTPMEVGVASADHAMQALETARKYTNKFGMYVTGIDRDESQDVSSKWKAFSYVGAVMTLPTGVQAISEARYGNPDRSLEYLQMLQNSFSYALPGSMYEVSPDYGMIAQAWNIYAVANPIIEYYFGVKPNAPNQKVVIQPNFPSSWPTAKIENVTIGKNQITIEKSKTGINITQNIPNWEIELILPIEVQLKKPHSESSKILDDKLQSISLTGSTNQIVFE